MNKEIKQLYEGLDDIRKSNIYSFFEKSPKMLLYLNLLDQKEVVQTNKAVNYIYQEELDNVARNVLINRFYKLRNKIRLWLLTQMKNSPICLTSEEQELAFLRLLVIKNEHVFALEKLEALEIKCWENNLFELLPEVLQLIFRTIHSSELFDLDYQQKYLDKLALANQLQQTLQQLKHSLSDIQINIKNSTVIIDTIRRKIKKLKQYPRFSLIYHYAAFSAGAHQEDVVKKMSNSLSRHLNQFNQLKATYPDIPIADFEPFHREKLELHFCIIESIFWYYKQENKKSYQAIKRRENYLNISPNFYPKKSIAELHNIIYFCMNAEQYQDALKYVEELQEYQNSNPNEEMDNPFFVYQLLIYIALFPKTKVPQPKELLDQVTLFLKDAPASSDWVYSSLAEFAILYGFYPEGRSFLQKPILTMFQEKYGIDIETDKLLELVASKDIKGLQVFIKRIQKFYKEIDSPKHKFHYKGLLKIAQHFVKN